MSATDASLLGAPSTNAAWDQYVRAERRRHGLPEEVSEQTAARAVATLVRRQNPVAARRLVQAVTEHPSAAA